MQTLLTKYYEILQNNLTIGEIIARSRKARGMTQSTLSELTGKRRASIAQIEKGIIKPDFDFLKIFVKKLNIPYHVIFDTYENIESHLNSFENNSPLIEGVRGKVFDEEGGKVRGKVMPENRNEKYIKSDPLSYYVQVESKGTPGGEKIVSEGDHEYNKPLSEQLSHFSQTHVRVMNKILDRIDELEQKVLELTSPLKK